MILQLADKQFLRSVADLVVSDPALAKQFFNSPDIDGMVIFEPISSLIAFLKTANEPISMEELVSFIEAIKNNDVKDIFITALNMSKKNASQSI